jgi:SagB-type dehydrogenase family enzyme
VSAALLSTEISVRLASRVYGADAVALDDPAEHFHEASKLHPTVAGRATRARELEHDVQLQASCLRAVRRNVRLDVVPLPDAELPTRPFAELVATRRSEREFAPDPLELDELAAILHAAYGRTHQLLDGAPPGVGPQFRAVPSGGGLYPLELFAFPWRVRELDPGLYHFDPLRRVLEVVRVGDLSEDVAAAMIYPDPATSCAVLVVVAGVFWRSRFKYGLRGYRFALIEAGHVMQNALLASTAFGLGSVALAGFFDARLEDVLALDGVEESALYAVAIGRRRSDAV